MPSLEVLLAFTAAALLLNISPGPLNFYVMARAIAQGARAGIVAALGLAAGSLLHVAAAVFGLAALFEHSPALYPAIKLAGAAYLVYLGVEYWRSKPRSDAGVIGKSAEKSPLSVFYESLLVAATNPRTALFFLSRCCRSSYRRTRDRYGCSCRCSESSLRYPLCPATYSSRFAAAGFPPG